MESPTSREQCAVIYLRVASSHQVDQQAIDRQREGCLRIAARHDLTIVREYADFGRPARLEQQTSLLQLLDDLDQRRDASFIIVWEYARLARSLTQLEEIVQRIRGHGADVVTLTGVEVADRFIHERERDDEHSTQEGGAN